MEYYSHICAGGPRCYLELLDKLQKRICRIVGPSLAASLEPCRIVKMWPASVFPIGITLVDVLQNWLNCFHFLFLERGLLVILIDCMIFCHHSQMLQGCLCQQFFYIAQLGSGILCL